MPTTLPDGSCSHADALYEFLATEAEIEFHFVAEHFVKEHVFVPPGQERLFEAAIRVLLRDLEDAAGNLRCALEEARRTADEMCGGLHE